VVAQALHTEGDRGSGPFVALDCGALPASLIESELFGHVRGAFTGASETRTGAFERAHRGTLFLDELGELPLDLQPKLLRVLETREVRKVGGSELQAVDVRIIAGTNRNLRQMVEDRTFRSDLYFRLAVAHVVLPPLRERLDDLPLLVRHFLHLAGVDVVGPIAGPNLALLRGHPWDGNVRELRNVLERAVACAPPGTLAFTDLPIELGPSVARPEAAGMRVDLATPYFDAKEHMVGAFEKEYLQQLLASTGGNVAKAARRAGINRRHLYVLMKKHGLK
jgi:DNA-binding NtrC family response regulator